MMKGANLIIISLVLNLLFRHSVEVKRLIWHNFEGKVLELMSFRSRVIVGSMHDWTTFTSLTASKRSMSLVCSPSVCKVISLQACLFLFLSLDH